MIASNKNNIFLFRKTLAVTTCLVLNVEYIFRGAQSLSVTALQKRSILN